MLRRTFWAAVWCGAAVLHAQETPASPQPAPIGTTHFITVADGVKLEVVDWGGTGRPLILLAGLGGHARDFGRFSAKLVPNYHVISLTRRGFAPSSVPASGYSADRLGDDVVGIIDALHLARPVLVGHSLAGEELSSVATRHPDKIAGLVYLDAGYAYALYDQVHGDLNLDALEAEKALALLQPGQASGNIKPLIDQLLLTLPKLELNLQSRETEMLTTRPVAATSAARPAIPEAVQAIFAGEEKFTQINVPTLALFAVPHDLGEAFKDNPALRARIEAADQARTETQVEAFERQVPAARVVRLPHANHLIFQSNEAEVLREMNAFIGGLP
jgi:non-heme chloroperoxidase